MDDGERIVALETRVAYVEKELEQANRTLTEIRDVLLQAKGARWLLAALVGVGGFAAGWSHKLLDLITSTPKP